MAEFNPSVVKNKLPQVIEDILKEHKSLDSLVEIVNDAAKQSNVPQVLNDAKALEECVRSLQDFVVRMCGQEGDSAADAGTLWSLVGAAAKIEKATGGGM